MGTLQVVEDITLIFIQLVERSMGTYTNMVSKIELKSLLLLLLLLMFINFNSKFKVHCKTLWLWMPVHLVYNEKKSDNCFLLWKCAILAGITIWISGIGVIVSLRIIVYHYTVCLFRYYICCFAKLRRNKQRNKQIQFEQGVYKGDWVKITTDFIYMFNG